MKLQLALLLAITEFILLLFIFSMFNKSLEEKIRVTEQNIYDSQVKKIQEIDQMFLEEIGLFESRIKKELQLNTSENVDIKPEIIKSLERIFAHYDPLFAELFGENGKGAYLISKGDEKIIKKAFKIMESSLASLINELNSETKVAAFDFKKQLITVAAESYGLNSEYIFSLFTQNLGKMKSFEIFDSHSIAILNPMKDYHGKVRYLLLLVWQPWFVEREYLKQVMRKLEISDSSHSLFFSYKTKTANSPEKWIRNSSDISLIISSNCREVPLCRKTVHQGRTYYLSRSPVTKIKRYRFGLIDNDQQILDEVSKLRQKLLVTVLIISIIVLFSWILMKKILLRPFDCLSSGVLALNERNFDFRVEPLGKDEFGRLAQAFNEMLESIQDLEVTRTLQETIFPEKTLVQNGWEFSGKCLPISEVGGDYYDFFEIDRQKVLFVIGDAVGHGISAALLVGMVKAAVFHPENSFEPKKILAHITAILASVFKKRRMMRCMIGIFDTASSTMRISNAGHCFPLVVNKNEVREISLPGFPAGVKIRNEYLEQTIDLSDQQWFLGYSDGLVESSDAEGNMIGYSRLAEILPEINSMNPAKSDSEMQESMVIINNLFSWHKSLVQSVKQKDDITLLAICRERMTL
ncbi:MAG: SpoIIE family protein phosphatase [Candidatus Riflebacteria bacterium]|nr:SpoIIE family protein phosphatase [Candidatus Riflebacteria bacterium]